MELSTSQDISHWLEICPFDLSENDRRSVMTINDSDWKPHTWDDLKSAIAAKDLSHLTRWPTDMRKYILWRREMRTTYPDIAKYITTKRLDWPVPTAQGFVFRNPVPFADPSDYCLRRNDWPYSLEKDVSHIVVWLKTPIEVDELGDPSGKSRRLIEDFVDRTFRSKLDSTNSAEDAEIIWFKNRTQWQTVRSLEHIHILTQGVGDSLVEQWTGQKKSDIINNSWSGYVPRQAE